MNFGYYPAYPGNNTYQQLAQMQQQNGSTFIHVPSEEVARNYAVTPGGSVTFINDNAPYCYTKTAGFNQFDAPVFRKFRLVEETDSPVQKQNQTQNQTQQENSISFVTVEAFSNEMTDLRARVESLESMLNQQQSQQKLTNQNQQNERRNKNESSGKQR